MNKKKLFLLLPVILIGIYLFKSNTVTIYVFAPNPEYKIDLKIEVDGNTVINDSLVHKPYEGLDQEIELSSGRHELKVISELVGKTETYSFYVLMDKNIIVEYFNEAVDNTDEKGPSFTFSSQYSRLRLD